jgi:hypothetical protein
VLPGPALAAQGPSHPCRRDTEQQRRRAALDGATLEELLADLDRALAAGVPESHEVFMAITRLAWFLGLEPAAALALEQRLRAGELDEASAALALAALGQAATAEALEVLARLVADAGLALELRRAALHSAFQLAQLSPALRTSVLAACDLGAPPALAQTALLLLGAAVAGETGRDPAAAQDLLAALLALEESASAAGQVEAWLAALGNAGAPESVAAITAYLADPAPEVRASAVAALGEIGGSEALEALIGVAQADAELGVRAEAIGSLGAAEAPAASAALCQLARVEPEPALRQSALLALAAQGPLSPSELETLSWCSQNDASAAVQELADAILEGQ